MIKHLTEIQAIAQSGLAYCQDSFDIARYNRLLEISASLLASHSTTTYEEIIELLKRDSGYVTPKIDVRGAIFKDNKILLVKEKTDQRWSLPGGWADVNLSPSENMIKEIQEETGYFCKITKLIAVLDKRKDNPESIKWPHVYKLFFLCHTLSENQLGFDENEITSVGFFPQDALPSLSIGRTSEKQIHICFEHAKNPLLPTEYD